MKKMDINKHISRVRQEYRLKQNQVAELTGLEPRHIVAKWIFYFLQNY